MIYSKCSQKNKMLTKNTISGKGKDVLQKYSPKQKLREFITTRPALQEIPKEVLQV